MFRLHRASFLYGPWGCPSSCIRHDMLDIHTFSSWTGTLLGRNCGRSRLLWNICVWMVRPAFAKNLMAQYIYGIVGNHYFPPRLSCFHVMCHSMISCTLKLKLRISHLQESPVCTDWWFTSFFLELKYFPHVCRHQDPCDSFWYGPDFQRKLHFIVPSFTQFPI